MTGFPPAPVKTGVTREWYFKVFQIVGVFMGLLKTLIKLLLWLAGLGVVALAALVILVTKIDPNEHKDWLEARFHKETGREISLDGPIAFTFYPWLGVEAADVSIADTEEFGAEPFVYLDYLKLRVKSLPLLREEYEVDTVAVRGAVVKLVRDEQGIANWGAFDGEAGEKDKPMLPLAAVALGGVAVEDARITLEDRQAVARYEFSGIDISTAELKYGEPVDISLDFRARSDKPALDASVSLAGIITYATDGEQFAVAPLDVDAVIKSSNIPGGQTSARLSARIDVDLDEETLRFDGLTLEGLGLKTAGRVEFSDIFDEVSASGQLEVAPFNLRRLARQLRQELPETADDDAFTRVALSGRFDSSPTALSLERVELQLDDTRLAGEFTMSDAASGPVTRFDLAVDQIDLDRYLAPDSQAKQTGGAAAALPIAALAATDLDGDLSVDRLIVSKARLDGFRMRLASRDGVLQADPVTAALYEGRLTAAAVLDATPVLPTLTLNTELTGIQAEPMLMDMTGKARLRGKGNFTAALTAQGDSVAAMKRNLSGPMSLSFTEGAITGFNLGRALRQWKQFKKGRIIDVEDSAATDFTGFTGNPVARNGIVRMDDLELKAPAFRLQGEGVLADLHNDTIDYRAVATIVNTAKGAGGRDLAELEGLALPLVVNGPLDDPKIRLAWEDILAGSLVEQVLDVFGLKLPGAQTPEESETAQETEEESESDPLQELLKEGLKEGLRGIFKKN